MDNTPRFLVYVNYFYLGAGPQKRLSLKSVPKEVEKELLEYLSGKFTYGFKKSRKNSKYETPYQIPTNKQSQVSPVIESQDCPKPGSAICDSKTLDGSICRKDGGLEKTGCNGMAGTEGEQPRTKRRSRKLLPAGAEATNGMSVKPVVTKTVSTVTIESSSSVPVEVSPKRGRGRPRKTTGAINEQSSIK